MHVRRLMNYSNHSDSRVIATFQDPDILPFHFSLAERAEIEGRSVLLRSVEKFPQHGPKKERRNGSRYWIVSIRGCCKMFYQLIIQWSTQSKNLFAQLHQMIDIHVCEKARFYAHSASNRTKRDGLRLASERDQRTSSAGTACRQNDLMHTTALTAL